MTGLHRESLDAGSVFGASGTSDTWPTGRDGGGKTKSDT